MHTTALAAGLACIAAIPAAAQIHGPPPPEAFVAVLAGAYATPPVQSAATGTVEVVWTGTALRYQVHLDSVRDVSGAYIHVGRAGDLTPAVADLFTGVHAGPVSGLLASGTLRTADLHGTTLDRLLRALRENDAYVTVHTLSLRGGELRGQLRRQPVETSQRSGDHG